MNKQTNSSLPIEPVAMGLNDFICAKSGLGNSMGSSLITGSFSFILSEEIVLDCRLLESVFELPPYQKARASIKTRR